MPMVTLCVVVEELFTMRQLASKKNATGVNVVLSLPVLGRGISVWL